MNDEDRKLGWRMYHVLKDFHRYYMPLDYDEDVHGLMNDVYDYFDLDHHDNEGDEMTKDKKKPKKQEGK